MPQARIIVFVFALAAAGALAEGERPHTPEQAADEVLAAIAAKDEKALAALAGKDEPDPWLVADVLCARGERAAAAAFARAAPRPSTEKLAAYVAGFEGGDEAVRDAMAEALRALQSGDATAALERLAKEPSSDLLAARRSYLRGHALARLQRNAESATAFRAAADRALRIGMRRQAAAALLCAGMAASRLSDWPAATACWERQLEVEQVLGHRNGIAQAVGNLGGAYFRMGDHAKALAFMQRALDMEAELGSDEGVALWVGNIGLVYEARGLYREALQYQQRALAMKEKLGRPFGTGGTLGQIGNLHYRLGDYPRALAFQLRALALDEKGSSPLHVARHLNNIGNAYLRFGDAARARDYYARALAIMETVGNRAGIAASLGNVGSAHDKAGDAARALDAHKRAYQLKLELGDRAGAAETLGNMAGIHRRAGDLEKALAFNRRALALAEEAGDRLSGARLLNNIGSALWRQKKVDEAAACHERALALSREIGSAETEMHALVGLAYVHFAKGAWAETVATAREAIAQMPRVAGGAAHEHGAAIRGRFADVFDLGARAAARLDAAADVAYFLESGRAGTLLESFGGRKTLRAAVLPAELLDKDNAARKAEAGARAAYVQARETGKRQAIAEAKASLERARARRGEVIGEIQRTSKAAARLVYPEADALGEIRSALRAGEALVLYSLAEPNPLAVVATREATRVVDLPPRADVERACAALRDDLRARRPVADAVAKLRQLVVAPLGLDARVKRLLVSPQGPLSFVPLSLVGGDREIVWVPSGTAYRRLTADRDTRGAGVLGVGDPDVGKAGRPAAALLAFRGGIAVPLPGTRDEIEAIADVKLLGKGATERGLRDTIARRTRWRAVHIACHGLFDAKRPMFSSLALAPSPGDDGFLTAREVLLQRIPADLVVLSACETGRGAAVKGEGVLGLTSAFMLAGAPRVIVSLWKVDDEATRALMVKFYELWKTKPTATALKEAQAHVRGQKKWSHPYYWAAWQLWGLGE